MRQVLPVFLCLLAACAGVPWSAPGPEPSPRDPAVPVPGAPPAAAPEPSPHPSSARPSARQGATEPGQSLDTLPIDFLRRRQMDADSAADALVLERLAQVHAPAGDSAGDPLEALTTGRSALSRLDLSTWVTHSRVRYYLDFFQGPARNRMAVWLTRLPVYEPMIRARFEAEGLPGDLVYLGLIESGYSNVAVSRSRAVGMWQFMRGTGLWMGLRVDSWVDERRDPVKATDAAARYLRYLTDRFGSYYLAAAAYNGGPGRVSRGLARVIPASTVPDVATVAIDGQAGPEEDLPGWTDADFFTLADTRHLHQETRDYVPKLIAASLIARDPVTFGFDPIPDVSPFPRDSIVVPDMTGLDVLAELAGASMDEVRALNPHFLRLATPPGRTTVRLPAGTMEKVTAEYATLPPSKRVRFREHFVKRGETLSGIAQRHRVSVADIRGANPAVRRSDRIGIGQRLVIPTVGGTVPRSGPDLSPAPARVAAGGGTASHTVRAGETLTSIAQRYGVRVAELQEWNRIRNPRSLKAGQRLTLRSPGAVAAASPGSAPRAAGSTTHLVRRGETLSGLARRYGVSVRALMEANGLSSGRELQAGRRIRIPS